MTFQKVGSNCGIFKQVLENRPNEFHMILIIEQPITFEEPCCNKILESTISSFREWVQST